MSRRALLSPVLSPVLSVVLPLAALAGACAPRVYPPGEPVAVPLFAEDRFHMADRAELPLRVWRPAEEPRAAILALHGFNDYSKAFESPANILTEAGYLVYAYDQRGFGDAPNRGGWPGVAGLVGDLRTASALVRARHPELPLVLLGESMGGAVIMAAMAQDADAGPAGAGPANGAALNADAAILSAPAVWARETMPAWQRVGLEIVGHAIPLMQFTGRGLNKTPSDNIDMLRKLSRDEKVIKWTRVDAIYGLVNLMDAAYAAAPALRGNVLILMGRREDIIPPEAMAAFERRLPPAECGLRLAQYDSGFHMLLRDLKAERALGDIAAWIADPKAPLPSGAERPVGVARKTAPPQDGAGAGAALALHCPPLRRTARP